MSFYTNLSGMELLVFAFAIFVDTLSAGLFIVTYLLGFGFILNTIVSIFAGIAICFLLWQIGCFQIKEAIKMLVFETVPIVNSAPAFSLITLRMIKASKAKTNSIQKPEESTTPPKNPFNKRLRGMYAFILIVSGLLAAPQAYAAAEISVSPKTPGSFTPITLRVTDFDTDISSANITWIIGGKTAKEGIGETTIETTTGAAGTPTTITVRVRGREGGINERTITIRPIDIDLLWQANTYTPPFYKGKALMTSESPVVFSVVPQVTTNGTPVSKENLIYTWKIDGKVDTKQSGYGKHTITARQNILRGELIVSVRVETRDGSSVGEKELLIPLSKPEIHFYEESVLRGTLYYSALDAGVTLGAQEGTIRAEPYFFAKEILNSTETSKTWRISNSIVPENNSHLLTVRGTEDTEGLVNISFSLHNSTRLLQVVKNSLPITLIAR